MTLCHFSIFVISPMCGATYEKERYPECPLCGGKNG